MASDLELEIPLVTYHMKVLASRGATREVGLAPEGGRPQYESTVAEDPEILALLRANEHEDEGVTPN